MSTITLLTIREFIDQARESMHRCQEREQRTYSDYFRGCIDALTFILEKMEEKGIDQADARFIESLPFCYKHYADLLGKSDDRVFFALDYMNQLALSLKRKEVQHA